MKRRSESGSQHYFALWLSLINETVFKMLDKAMRQATLLILGWLLALQVQAANVLVLELEGVIGPASKDFVIRGLETAKQRDAELVVLKLNTPGGLDGSMRDIITAILASPIPVASYVAPDGARAASAGTYILYASHIAAMAPATNLGAATPVQIGGGGLPDIGGSREDRDSEPDDDPRADDQQASADEDEATAADEAQPREPARRPASGGTAMERKLINDAKAYIRSLAQLRGRNAEWAEQSVTEAASLSARDALDLGVIDIVAKDIPDLLAQAHGRTVEVVGEPMTLALDQPAIETVEPDWRNQLLAIITHPQIAYILMLLGIYGLFFEFSNPGALVPGVLGGICLLLALFAFQVLPINYAGLALILLGIAFMIAEVFMPSFGILGLGGLVAFVAGSIILWDDQGMGYDIPVGLIAGFAVANAVIIIGLGTLVMRNYRRQSVTGDRALASEVAVVVDDFENEGRVRVHGETWRARSKRPLVKGTKVRVVERDGLTLIVEAEEE